MLHLAPNLKLPVEAVTQTFALLARRGAGKTHTASVMAEEMLQAGFPIVWLDPLGVAWGLRTKYPIIIFGGKKADIPLEPTAGAVVADFLVAKRVSAILDVSAFGENEMRRFVGEFADRFYRTNTESVHWFVDEADEFAPQQAAGGPMFKCLGAMQNIVRRGRARGIGVTLITQRSAVLNKSVLTQTECLIAMQTTSPQDKKVIDDWVKDHGDGEDRDKIMKSLPTLQQGEAWVYSPGWLKTLQRVKFRARHSFDSSSTPKPGETKKAPKTLAEIDVSSLTKEMQATIERVKAEDPKLLQRKIADLEKQLKSKQPAPSNSIQADPAATQRAIATAVERAVSAANRDSANTIKQLERKLATIRTGLEKLIAGIGTTDLARQVQPATAPAFGPIPTRSPAAPIAPRAPVSPVSRPRPVSGQSGDSGELSLGKAERAILTACYWIREDREITPAKVAFYSGYAKGSGGFNNALGRLRSNWQIAGLAITESGIDTVQDLGVDDRPTGPELREWLRKRKGIGKAENGLLDALIAAYPNRLTNEELSAASGYAAGSGGFNNALGKLRSIEAAEGYAQQGGTKASDIFFE